MKTPLRSRAAQLIDSVVFYSLLTLIALVAIPYGTVEPWWNALFQCVVFFLAGLSVIERFLGAETSRHDRRLFFPVLALMAFALLQTIPWSNPGIAGINVPRTVSADAFQTRLFVVQLGALVLVGWMLARYLSSPKRLRLLVQLIIAVAVLSALFGLWRQASQRQVGFVLPYLRPGFGYAQFINTNHFAYLMEMALGLALGIAVCRGLSGARLGVYLMAAVPMFVALVLANSRGGILSFLCQVVFLAALFVARRNPERHAQSPAKTGLSGTRMLLLRGVLVATLLTGAVVTVVFVGGDPLVGRINSLSVELDQKTADSFTLRPTIWRATWKLIREHPVAGVGFGGYWVAITKYHQASGETSPQQAHSDYLELLASGGLIGLLIGIWFTLEFVRSARRPAPAVDPFGRAAVPGALAGILAVAVHSLVDFGLHITINALVFTVLIVMVSLRVRSQSPREKSGPGGSPVNHAQEKSGPGGSPVNHAQEKSGPGGSPVNHAQDARATW